MRDRMPYLTYAFLDGNLVHISEVESGLGCNAYCPACGGRLVARKGEIKIAHFAHYASDECSHGYETALHIAAKNILAEHKTLMLPALYLYFPDSYKERVLISEKRQIQFDQVILEETIDNIIPDVIIQTQGKKLLVEIFVTHKIDDEKRKKIKKLGISTLEIDLSSVAPTLTPEELYESLISNTDNKEWIYNSLQEKYFNQFYDVTERLYLKKNNLYFIDGCPISKKVWEGKPNAHINYDCMSCRFCIARNDNSVLCSGKNLIASIEDFKKSKQERADYYKKELEREKMKTIGQGICPVCRSILVNRKGKKGSFIGCSDYPHCRFTINIDPETGELRIKDQF